MKILTQLIIAGLGTGDFELVTPKAVNIALNADMILVPRSKKSEKGLAETILSHYVHDREITALYFPMTRDENERDKIILSQLENIRSKIEQSHSIFFPVIGDSSLYSTGAYLLSAMKKIIPDVKATLIPGISAHSVAASCAGRFMAMSDEIFTIIPGTASPEKILSALKNSDSAAIYKPTAVKSLRELVIASGFSQIIRVDYAGIPEREKITEGITALDDVSEYLSVILLRR